MYSNSLANWSNSTEKATMISPQCRLHCVKCCYEGRLKSSWTGCNASQLCRKRRWLLCQVVVVGVTWTNFELGRLKKKLFMMAERLYSSLVERQRCAIEFWKPTTHPSSLRRRCNETSCSLKWWKRFRDGETNVKSQNRLFHYPSEACGKRSASRLREVGGAL
jgi:hypothetical protein